MVYYRYGGVYRIHLYGSSSIIVCDSSICKHILNLNENFKAEWPTNKVLGRYQLMVNVMISLRVWLWIASLVQMHLLGLCSKSNLVLFLSFNHGLKGLQSKLSMILRRYTSHPFCHRHKFMYIIIMHGLIS